MASTQDAVKEKKKIVYRKIENSFEFFNGENNMKNPLTSYSKPSSKFKSSNITSGKYDDSYNKFHGINEKRSNRRYNGEFGEYLGSKLYPFNESIKDNLKHDSGRPPGNTDNNSDNLNVVTPVILAREKNCQESEKATENSSPQLNEIEPVKNEVESSKPPLKAYKIVSKANVIEANVTPEQFMVNSVKLFDDSLLLGEDLSQFLIDQSSFLVIAVVGLQGAGKSTIASLLAETLDNVKKGTESFIFLPENREEVLSGCHATTGADIFVSKNRVIVIDIQPLLSPSVMDYAIVQERKPSHDFSSSENLLEAESLQLLTFAMSVAHILVVVQDCILHPNMIRLLHTCQMMKPFPASSASGSSTRESALDGSDQPVHHQHFPHVIFVHNRAFPQHFTPTFIEEMQNFYRLAMKDSDLKLESQIGISNNSFVMPINSKTYRGRINLFLIPDINFEHKCCISFRQSMQEMRRQIFRLSRPPLTHVNLTEKSWYQFTCRMWDTIRNSNLYVEYSRHLP